MSDELPAPTIPDLWDPFQEHTCGVCMQKRIRTQLERQYSYGGSPWFVCNQCFIEEDARREGHRLRPEVVFTQQKAKAEDLLTPSLFDGDNEE